MIGFTSKSGYILKTWGAYTMKILIIEDDSDIAELLDYTLKKEHFETEVCADGVRGLARVQSLPDAIILDLMLPNMNGFDICKAVRSAPSTQHIPILMLTAKGDEMDRIIGLEIGADDYLTKPFSPRELVLRVKAILRRRESASTIKPLSEKKSERVTFGILSLDTARFEVTVGEKPVKLTAIEFKLLHYLLTTKGRVATRDLLLDAVWGFDAALTTRTVDTHIKRLRQKIGDAGAYIETIRSIGYRCKETPDKEMSA